MMTNIREINQNFRLAKKYFSKAIELAKKNLIIGEVNFPSAPKAVRTRKAKGPDLPDADAKGYMKERKKEETD
jgi:hypothetical protein